MTSVARLHRIVHMLSILIIYSISLVQENMSSEPSVENMRRGCYNPLPEDDDGGFTSFEKNGHNSRANVPWPFLILSALCGFLLALVLVNSATGEMIGSVGKTKLQKLLDGNY